MLEIERMERGDRMIIPVFIFAIIAILIIVMNKAGSYYSEIERRGIRVKATILSVDAKMTKTQTPQYYYKVWFIGVDGKEYESTMHFQKELEIFSEVYVKYLPDKPKFVNYSYFDNVTTNGNY